MVWAALPGHESERALAVSSGELARQALRFGAVAKTTHWALCLRRAPRPPPACFASQGRSPGRLQGLPPAAANCAPTDVTNEAGSTPTDGRQTETQGHLLGRISHAHLWHSQMLQIA